MSTKRWPLAAMLTLATACGVTVSVGDYDDPRGTPLLVETGPAHSNDGGYDAGPATPFDAGYYPWDWDAGYFPWDAGVGAFDGGSCTDGGFTGFPVDAGPRDGGCPSNGGWIEGSLSGMGPWPQVQAVICEDQGRFYILAGEGIIDAECVVHGRNPSTFRIAFTEMSNQSAPFADHRQSPTTEPWIAFQDSEERSLDSSSGSFDMTWIENSGTVVFDARFYTTGRDAGVPPGAGELGPVSDTVSATLHFTRPWAPSCGF